MAEKKQKHQRRDKETQREHKLDKRRHGETATGRGERTRREEEEGERKRKKKKKKEAKKKKKEAATDCVVESLPDEGGTRLLSVSTGRLSDTR